MPDRDLRRTPRRHRRAAFAVLATALGVLLAPAGVLPEGAGVTAATLAGDTLAGQPWTGTGVLRVQAADDGVVGVGDEMRGVRRHLDTLEFRAGSSGTLLVNELGMEDYVAGVAEMPSRWHLEALQAQAVAARTYAWYSIELGTFSHYDICATVACQVFRGAEVVLDDLGDRWREAVDATAGQVLVDDAGAPILARYFSTSGGRTYPNELVFPAEGPRPFLVGTEDPADAVSPYHRWTVPFTRAQFDDIVARGETLGPAAPVVDVRREGDVHDPFADVVVTGADGTEVRVGVRTFREFVSRIAAERHPDEFPGVRGDGLRRLPETLPSSRFTIDLDDDHVIIEGRGWGHGVGMGQYGALGRAEQGQDHAEILAAYYDGRRPTSSAALPERVRVGLDVADTFTLRPSQTMRITLGDEVVEETAIGTWTVTRVGEQWTLTPPEGHDAALDVSATRPAAGIDLGDAVVVEVEVNRPALLRLSVRDADGNEVLSRDLGAADPGSHAASWRYEDAGGAAVPAGDYAVALLARDTDGSEAGSPLTVTVGDDQAAAVAERIGTGDATSGPGSRVVALLAAAVLAVLLLPLVLRRSRRSPS
ncbi:SpoIID/LytB domain-containing protein [Egicoccus halophilus]|uniref:SpoIID/LytB domain-containing protein n=1 Tax=Egicoccus halophilus TaxID=1670830 RepID=A0A8J3A601_9ACTN|nr:SpoIID/LytB domain-containing protein [Egicoccus halophilus]GGI04049.1 hypothetical protein GCM10011354_07110 [Egicoccus halophilus]